MYLQKLQTQLQQARATAERKAVGLRTVDDMSTSDILSEASKTQASCKWRSTSGLKIRQALSYCEWQG